MMKQVGNIQLMELPTVHYVFPSARVQNLGQRKGTDLFLSGKYFAVCALKFPSSVIT